MAFLIQRPKRDAWILLSRTRSSMDSAFRRCLYEPQINKQSRLAAYLKRACCANRRSNRECRTASDAWYRIKVLNLFTSFILSKKKSDLSIAFPTFWIKIFENPNTQKCKPALRNFFFSSFKKLFQVLRVWRRFQKVLPSSSVDNLYHLIRSSTIFKLTPDLYGLIWTAPPNQPPKCESLGHLEFWSFRSFLPLPLS